jgi:hypothetical protein
VAQVVNLPWLVRGPAVRQVEAVPAAAPTAQPTKPDKPEPKAPARPPVKGDLLTFLNGDKLHGDLVSLEPAEGVVWRHPDVAGPVTFKTDHLDTVLLQASGAKPGGKQTAAVELANGGRLPGTVVGLTPDTLELDTGYAGGLSIRRAALKSVLFEFEQESTIYSGPTGLAGWQVFKIGGSKGWQYKKGAFYSPGRAGGIGRNFKFPKQSRIRWRMAWRGYPQVQIYLFTQKLNTSTRSTYMLNISNDYFYIQRRDPKAGYQQISNFNIRGFGGRAKARMEVLVDQEKKAFYLKIDGLLVQQWAAPQGKFDGKGLMFYSYSNTAMKISEIEVSSWDGVIASGGPAPKEVSQDTVLLNNEDKVTGTIQSIQNGKLKIKTDFAVIDIPLARVASVVFKGKGKGSAPRGARDVQVSLHGGGKVFFRLDKMADGRITGSAPEFGKIAVKRQAAGAIRFNLAAKREQEDDEDW